MTNQWQLIADDYIRTFQHSCGVQMLFSNRATDEGIERAQSAHFCLPNEQSYHCVLCRANVIPSEVIDQGNGQYQHEVCCGYVTRTF